MHAENIVATGRKVGAPTRFMNIFAKDDMSGARLPMHAAAGEENGAATQRRPTDLAGIRITKIRITIRVGKEDGVKLEWLPGGKINVPIIPISDARSNPSLPPSQSLGRTGRLSPHARGERERRAAAGIRSVNHETCQKERFRRATALLPLLVPRSTRRRV